MHTFSARTFMLCLNHRNIKQNGFYSTFNSWGWCVVKVVDQLTSCARELCWSAEVCSRRTERVKVLETKCVCLLKQQWSPSQSIWKKIKTMHPSIYPSIHPSIYPFINGWMMGGPRFNGSKLDTHFSECLSILCTKQWWGNEWLVFDA